MKKTKKKCVFLGNAGVGKSSIMYAIQKSEFKPTQEATIGAAFGLYETEEYQYQMWDTAGHERFKSLVPLYVKDSNVVLFVAQCDKPDTINDIESIWGDFLNQSSYCLDFEHLKIIVLINKCDLDHSKYMLREHLEKTISKLVTIVNSSRYDSVLTQDDIPCLFISAKTGENIEKIFETIDEMISKGGGNEEGGDDETEGSFKLTESGYLKGFRHKISSSLYSNYCRC